MRMLTRPGLRRRLSESCLCSRPFVTDPDILTAGRVAELLGMHPQAVRRAVREQGLPSHRVDGRRAQVFYRDEVLAWLRGHPAAPEAPSM